MKLFLKRLLSLAAIAATFGMFAVYLFESAESIMAEEGEEIWPRAVAAFAAGAQGTDARPAAAQPARLSAPSGPAAPPAGQWRIIERAESYNKELQYYSPDNVMVQEDSILITSKKEARGNKRYTSGMVESNACFLYGRFFFTIRISEGKGLFPAIWLLPAEDKPLPEIDIFEMIGSKPDRFYGVLHYMEGQSQKRAYFCKRVEPKESYEISLIWAPQELSWYIDGACVLTLNEAIPSEPMYLIINQAVGGVWPRSPNRATQFPAAFTVESIHIDADWSGAR